MPILVFRHGPSEPIGLIADSLDVRGVEWHYADPSTADPENAQAVIVMGGSMSVNDPLPWLRDEERAITRAISSGTPVLGVCLGAQLLAKCLGAKVAPMGHKEIGWHPVRFTEAGLQDPLFAGLSPQETFFHWHGENFALPGGAELLASSAGCPHQAFRAGENLYGLQFHPEVTPEIINQWCQEDEACGDNREASDPVDAHAHEDRARELAEIIFGRWCDLVAIR